MTMRISEYRNVLITFAAFAARFDQGDAGPLKAQNRSSIPDVPRGVIDLSPALPYVPRVAWS